MCSGFNCRKNAFFYSALNIATINLYHHLEYAHLTLPEIGANKC
ncbi:hypothetical protein CHELA1G11_13687 [Hyphomicrobiales bacterium]|nr:hypothetical protein CHELA1G2_10629 [Hyphomicrobiales bacterium]CAH1673337.1 hypothetical protein CHELA1G11_13687 [Hyphomicrobiales bacterium]